MKNKCCNMNGACGGGVYGLGFLGVAVFYISHATNFWMGVIGFLKAMVWPAFLAYDVLNFISR